MCPHHPSPLTNGVGTTMNTISAPSVATDTSVVASISSLSLMPGRYGVFSCVLPSNAAVQQIVQVHIMEYFEIIFRSVRSGRWCTCLLRKDFSSDQNVYLVPGI